MPAHSTANDKQTIVINEMTDGTAAAVITETNVDATNFRFKPEHEYTVEKITAINWLYDAESDNMNAGIKTRYQNGINGGTTETITDLIPVKVLVEEKVNYPPIGSNKYIATEENSAAATAASTTDPGIAPAVAGPQLQTFSQYPNNGALISGETASDDVVGSVNKLETIPGTTVSNIIINKDYAKIPTTVSTPNTVGMSIRLGVKIGTGTETFTNFCTFTKSACSNKDLSYNWGPINTETIIATIGSGTTTVDDVVPADIYAGIDDWKKDNQSYWFASDSIKISTHQNINNVIIFYGKSVVFKVYVYYHSADKVYNANAATAVTAAAAAANTASWTLSNTTAAAAAAAAGNYYDNGGLTLPTPIPEPLGTTTKAGEITYTDGQVYTVLGLPILKTGKMPSITYNFDNKSTKWALHTDTNTKVLDVKLAPEEPTTTNTANVLSTTDTDNTKHTWSTTTNVPLATGLTITYPNPSSFTSLVHDAKLFVKATNIVGTQAAWYTDWSGNTKFIYDPNTLALIETITAQSVDDINLKVAAGASSGSFKGIVGYDLSANMTVLGVSGEFNPSVSVEFSPEKINLTQNLWTLNDENKRSLLIYDGKFCSEQNFKTAFENSSGNWSATNDPITTQYDDYHANVTKIINAMPATTVPLNSYRTASSTFTPNLKTDYRWAIFQYKFQNTQDEVGAAPAFALDVEFDLGSDSDITRSDLINDGNKLSNVEIWIKFQSDSSDYGKQTRWNKLTHGEAHYQASPGDNNVRIVLEWDVIAAKQPPGLVSSSWDEDSYDNFDTSAEKTLKIFIGAATSSKTIILNDGIGTLFIAIGIHNNCDKCIGIPQVRNKLSRL